MMVAAPYYTASRAMTVIWGTEILSLQYERFLKRLLNAWLFSPSNYRQYYEHNLLIKLLGKAYIFLSVPREYRWQRVNIYEMKNYCTI